MVTIKEQKKDFDNTMKRIYNEMLEPNQKMFFKKIIQDLRKRLFGG